MKKIFYKSFFLLLLSLSLGVLNKNSLFAQEVNSSDNKEIFGQQDKTLTVYPMPATSTAYIRIAAGLRNEIDRLEIVNIVGRKVSEQKIVDKATTEVVFNNLNTVPKGLYMVVARDKFGKVLQSAKLLLNNN